MDENKKMKRSSSFPNITLHQLANADFELIPKNNPLCPHKHHCFQHAVLKGFFRTFAAAYVFKTSLKFLLSLLGGRIINRKKINLDLIKKIFQDPDSIRFSQTIGLMSFTYKAIVCLLRNYEKKNEIYHKTISGFLCSLWIMIDNKQRQKTFALYCIFRSISDLLSYQTSQNKIPKIKHADVIGFALAQIFIMRAMIHDSKSLDPGYHKWLQSIGDFSDSTIQVAFRSPTHLDRPYRDTSFEPFIPCYPVYHSDYKSCFKHNGMDWLKGLIRSAKLYIPVHFLPMLLLTPKKVFNHPLDYLMKKSRNALISSVFLTTYTFNVKSFYCYFRNLLQGDPAWISMMGGLVAGLALFIEYKHRRPELALYCIPKAVEVIIRSIDRTKYPKIGNFLRWKYLRILLFQISVAIWVTLLAIPKGRESANSLNVKILEIVFGKKH